MSSPSAPLHTWFFARGDASAAAAVRIAFAGCYLFMLWDLHPVRDLLLGHGGYFGTLDERYIGGGFLNLLYHADSPAALGVWFGVAALSAVLVLVGLLTRIALPLSMVCLVLLHRRNPFILFGADLVLFNIGLWLTFLRCGRAWAVDQWVRRRLGAAPSREIPLWPLRALQIQIALIYFRTAMAKLATEPWQEGSAVYYALHALGNDVFPEVMEHKLLLTLLGYTTLGVEFGFPFLVFWQRTRWLAILSAMLVHLGIDLLMAIRFFGLVMYAGLASFVLPQEWLAVERMVRRWMGKVIPLRLQAPDEVTRLPATARPDT